MFQLVSSFNEIMHVLALCHSDKTCSTPPDLFNSLCHTTDILLYYLILTQLICLKFSETLCGKSTISRGIL